MRMIKLKKRENKMSSATMECMHPTNMNLERCTSKI